MGLVGVLSLPARQECWTYLRAYFAVTYFSLVLSRRSLFVFRKDMLSIVKILKINGTGLTLAHIEREFEDFDAHGLAWCPNFGPQIVAPTSLARHDQPFRSIFAKLA
jgi:hypothetical protein